MQIHSNATTCHKQRKLFRESARSCRSLSNQFCVSVATIHRWKRRTSTEDRSSRPKTIRYALSEEESQLALFLRKARLSLDETVEQLVDLVPHVRRASIHRLFVREGLNRLPRHEQQPTGEPGVFKDYDPGYLHIDCFYLPILEGKKRYAFVAVDRATRLVFLNVYDRKDKQSASDFLRRCLAFYPFRIHTILTDNGSEFTNAHYKGGRIPVKNLHPFGLICRENGTEHRQTQVCKPSTNGMAERTVGLVKDGTTKRHRYENAAQMIADLKAWHVVYNFERKHRRLSLKTPYQAVCDWYERKPGLFIKVPTSLLAYRSQCYET